MMPLRTVDGYRPIDDLKPYAGNARTHSEKQIAQIAASIRTFGYTNPVLIGARGQIGFSRIGSVLRRWLPFMASMSEADTSIGS
jgi:hypothetical protein